ncbi:glycosyltransferase family 2 protein [Candidatus Daviesbacteria bacterium]|nr:glycosyltransferase family 2 protein [Candidatus Daviesbacteria bacterium]
MKRSDCYPTVSIVIPVYNSNYLPAPLLKSLKQLAYPKNKLEIILVEILSHVKDIRLNEIKIKNILINQKTGYSEAANRGIEESAGDFILLLNPDVQLDTLTLKYLIDCITGDKRIAIVGPRAYSMLQPNNISGFDLPVSQFNRSLGVIKPIPSKNLGQLGTNIEVEWISGSAMLFKRSLWKKLKGFDKQFFLYWEDADFCIRAKKMGLKIILVPQAKIWHQGSASVGADNPIKHYYLKRNSMIFLKKHANFKGLLVENFRTAVLVLAKIFRFIMQKHRREESYMYLLGVLDFYRGKTANLDKL